jgi:hypothetical protein
MPVPAHLNLHTAAGVAPCDPIQSETPKKANLEVLKTVPPQGRRAWWVSCQARTCAVLEIRKEGETRGGKENVCSVVGRVAADTGICTPPVIEQVISVVAH